MTYYIDFDNTLFNTVDFYNDLEIIMKNYGITSEMIDKYSNFNKLFSPIKLVNYCIEKYHINNEILNEINNHFKKANDYNYNDIDNFLVSIKKKGNRLVLLTYGNYLYQDLKIKNSGLAKYFDEIIITEKEKDTLELDFKNGIFIDDNPTVISKLLLKNPYKIIRIKRKNNRYSNIVINNMLVSEYENFKDIID